MLVFYPSLKIILVYNHNKNSSSTLGTFLLTYPLLMCVCVCVATVAHEWVPPPPKNLYFILLLLLDIIFQKKHVIVWYGEVRRIAVSHLRLVGTAWNLRVEMTCGVAVSSFPACDNVYWFLELNVRRCEGGREGSRENAAAA